MQVTRRTLFQALCTLPFIKALLPQKVEPLRISDVDYWAEMSSILGSESTVSFMCRRVFTIGETVSVNNFFEGRVTEVSTKGDGLYTIKAIDHLSWEQRYGRTRS